MLPARQTEDECREVRRQTGIAPSIKRQPCWLTRLRLWPGRVETSGSCVRQDAANPIKGPATETGFSGFRFDFCPVGRATQAMVCKSIQVGATPARDSNSSGIGVERYTPVFQTGVRGAIPRCPSNLGSGRRAAAPGRRSAPTLPCIFRDAKSRCRSELHRSGRGGSTPPSRSLGLQTLPVKSRLLTGENSVRIRGNPPFPHPW